jgi:predicted DNA-binding protein (MmcQ/YjbR family)
MRDHRPTTATKRATKAPPRTAAGAAAATSDLRKAEQALRRRGLAYPGAYEEFPWGHSALKVKGRAFAFLAFEKGVFSFSVKLPESSSGALLLPFAEPTGYGLGRSGWVTASFRAGESVPVPILSAWLDESYRAIAPRKLVAQMQTSAAPERAVPRPRR